MSTRVSPPAPGPFRYHLVRLFLRACVRGYVRTAVQGAEQLPPAGPYIICFNHPSWLDPIVLAGLWPDRARRLFVFGPREQDMGTGLRNHVITWTRRAVPFKPRAQDVIDTTRRAVAVLETGACLAIAGEGRLSDHAGEARPLETGLAHFARLARAPIVPTAIIGTRWVHFGSRVTVRIGEPVHPDGFARGKAGARAMTDVVQDRLQAMLDGVQDGEPPGWFGRTLSEAFNERPWLDAPAGAGERGPAGGAKAAAGEAEAAAGGVDLRSGGDARDA